MTKSADRIPFDQASILDFSKVVSSPSVCELYGWEEYSKHRLKMWKLQLEAFVTVLALYGEDAEPAEHIGFSNFLITRPIGMHLIVSASLVRQSRNLLHWNRFSRSLKAPGSLIAWLEWSKVLGTPVKIDNKEWILRLIETEENLENDPTSLYLAEKAIQSLPIPGTREFYEYMSEVGRIQERKRKKRERKKPSRQNIYKEFIRSYFFQCALWCRSTSNIVGEHFESADGKAVERHESGVNKAFSELGLTKVRRKILPECPDTR